MNAPTLKATDIHACSKSSAVDLARPSPEDRIAIVELIACLALHTDECEWDRLESGLMPEVMTDYVSLLGGVPQTLSRNDLVAQYRALMPGFDANQHMIVTVDVGLHDSNSAVARSQVRATHRLGQSLWVVGGMYTHGLIRTPQGWCVAYVKFSVAYEEGDRSLVAKAAERAKEAG